MIGKVSQAKLGPTLQGIMSQVSTYGATIPEYLGTTSGSPLVIWINGIRKAASAKKGTKKSQATTYRGCVDMLVGHNPIIGIGSVHTQNVGQATIAYVQRGVSGPSYTITDPLFHIVTAVTVNVSYSVTFNDYGGPGTTVFSGTAELPLWNAVVNGPNPTNTSAYRFAPHSYYNVPLSAVVSGLYGGGSFNIYYAGFPPAGYFGANITPLNNLLQSFFESSLGDGSAYTGYQNFSAQRIVYPWYAGIGSYNFDLGLGAMPQIRMEVYGAYGLYPDSIGPNAGGFLTNSSADCDFADMIEHVFRLGQKQANILATGVGTASGISNPVQTGVSCWEYPGTVQRKFWANACQGSFTGTIQFDIPVTKGDWLVVAVAQNSSGSPIGVSDSLGNSWGHVVATAKAGFFYAQANSTGLCVITVSNYVAGADVQIFEVGGADTLDVATAFTSGGTATLPTGSVAITTTPTQNEYLMTWVFPDLAADVGSGSYAGWKKLIPAASQGGNFFGFGTANSYTQYKITSQPGTYTFTGDVATNQWVMVIAAFKNAVAPSYPKPLGDILDQPSLDQLRLQDRAYGLKGSLNMNSTRKASDWLQEIYTCADAWFVWSGFRGKSIPLSEQSYAGNGAVYTAPTASGPILDIQPQDYIGDPGKPMVSVQRTSVVERTNLLRIQFPDRNGVQYANAIASEPDVGSLSLFGLRYGAPKVLPMIQRMVVARMVLGYMVRRATNLVNKYSFKLQARFKLLEAGDLITISDPKIGLVQLPVRLTSVQEGGNQSTGKQSDTFGLTCEAEDFIYGTNAPVLNVNVAVTESQGNGPPTTVNVAAVNTPVFLEPPGQMTQSSQDELWIGVSDSDPNYGGCQMYVSVDSGASYNPLQDLSGLTTIAGSAVTGYTTSSWPQALDPDTTNDLPVNLTESNGALLQYSTNQEDQFDYPCYVAGGGGLYPFEIMTYAVATLTSAFNYTLKATGGNHLRRAVFGTWASQSLPNTGPLHANNSRFAFVDPAEVGWAHVAVPAIWFGLTLYFKFIPFNQSGIATGSLSTAVAYPYTILGNANGPGGGTGGSGGGTSSSYTINPSNPLSQTSTTNIHMVNVVATWSPSGLQTFYFQRNFTIPAPTAPTTYYVTVYDPNQTGDTGAAATLNSYCNISTVNAHVGQAGYIYMGSIVANAAGTGSGGQGGGSNPSGGLFIQIPIPSTTRGVFQIAHGQPKTPSDVDIKIQQPGLGIFFQSPTAWDATNVYLEATDDGLTGFLVIQP